MNSEQSTVNSEALIIRTATTDDAALIAQHRRAMFADMGELDAAQLDAMTEAFVPWVCEKFARDEYCGWLAEGDSAIVASAGLWLMEWSPLPHDLTNRRGRVMNMYTHPAYRRRGLARQLMGALVDWSRARGLRSLHLDASAMGRGLYAELGFDATHEMRLKL